VAGYYFRYVLEELGIRDPEINRIMRTIVISISLGRYCRIFTLSAVADLLLREPNVRLLILSPAAHLEEFRSRIGLHENVVFENLPDYLPPSRLSQRIIRNRLVASGRHKRLFLSLMRLYGLVQEIQEPRRFDEVFRRYKPSLVITASPGFNSLRDIPLIREANRTGIPTLCVLYGWDNLTMNGFMPVRPANLAVWNALMKQEAVEIHHYDAGVVRVVGPPQFDLYQDRDIFLPRDKFFGQLGLDPGKKVILFATATLKWSDNTFILDIIERAIQRGALAKPCQVICRLHPLGKGKDRKVYELFRGSRHVKFDSTSRFIEPLGWTPDLEDVVHIANLVYHSDVVVNIASTMAIEAAYVPSRVTFIEVIATSPPTALKVIRAIVVCVPAATGGARVSWVTTT
jgi:hypothetical protein